MKAFWNDRGHGWSAEDAQELDLAEASRIWSDEVRGIRKNFFGLIDDQGRAMQFYFEASIPDHIDDASHLQIVSLDFPQPERNGSYSRYVTIGEVYSLIEKAFAVGADYRQFGELTFELW